MRSLLIVAAFACVSGVHAQNVLLRAGLDSLCTGRLLDPGGELNYAPDADFITTLCPAGATRQLALTFQDVDIRRGDLLCIYDGADTSATLLTCASDWPRGGTDVQASVDNPSGCLTLHWRTDGQGQGRGFAASVTCRSICQTITPLITLGPGALDSTGVWEISLCAGQLFELTAGVAFPQNDRAYHQDEARTTYLWRRADGSELRGPVLTEAFASGGAYAFELTAVDERGCRSLPARRIRARVAPRPTFELADEVPDTLCAPADLQLQLRNSLGGDLRLTTPTEYFPIITQRVDSLPLPDGTGAAHESTIPIAHFAPDTKLSSAEDLQRVCATMEHSWLRDLSIDLIAPEGQVIELHDHPGRFGTEVYLGEPIERDNNASPPLPGLGYEYCWTPSATRGTWLGYLRDNPLTKTLPAGDYAPRTNFSALIGASANGAWRLRVRDHWEADNGWIFSWRLDFADGLPLRRDSFATRITDLSWLPNPAQASTAPGTITFSPSRPGLLAPAVTALDDFGCRYDTSFTVVVLPNGDPSCLPCASRADTLAIRDVVRGDTVRFDLARLADTPGTFYSIGTKALTQSSHPATRPLEIPLFVRSAPLTQLGASGAGLVEICVDIAVADASDLTLALRSPSGKTLLLARNDAPGRVGFRQTCFRPDAQVGLEDPDAVSAGSLRPRESWGLFSNEATSGQWVLSVSDDRGPRDTTWVYGYSLVFSDSVGRDSLVVEKDVFQLEDGNWATRADTNRVFRFERVDASGCERTLYVPLRVREPCGLTLQEIGYQSPGCPQESTGNLVLLARGQQGTVLYRVGDEINTDGKFTAVPSGPYLCNATDSVGCEAILEGLLPAADTASVDIYPELRACVPPRYAVATDTFSGIAVRSLRWVDDALAPTDFRDSMLPGSYRLRIEDARGCITYSALELSDFAPMRVEVLAKAPTCAGGGDGELLVKVEGGVPGHVAVWEDFDLGLERKFLYAGRYRGTVHDSVGCMLDFSAEVPDAPAMEVRVEVRDADCADEDSGFIRVTVRGGTAPYLYQVDDAPFINDRELAGMAPGTHVITVQDAGFCESSQAFTVGNSGRAAKPLRADEIGLPEELLAGDTITLRVPEDAGVTRAIRWSYTETAWFSCVDCAETRFAAWESGTLALVQGATGECPSISRYSLRIQARNSVLVPTGFSPDSGQAQDRVLQVHGRSGTVIDRFAVFDRWGALIYEDRDFRVNSPRGWDGTLRGSPAPAGVYLYEVDVREVSGAVSRIRGSTQLVR